MSKRFDVYPSFIGDLLRDWARRLFVEGMYKVARGYPSKAAFINLKVDGQATEIPLWRSTKGELDRLDAYINQLETRHVMALNWAFVPNRERSAAMWLASTGTVPRTWRRWVHEAAGELANKWERVASHEDCAV